MQLRTRRNAAARETMVLVSGREYRVLSIHPEWAWAIVFGSKEIEYRRWATRYRGELLIHASSKRSARVDIEAARDEILSLSDLSPEDLPEEFPRSSILGSVELADCVETGCDYEWMLRNPRPLAEPVTNIAGKLQIWRWTPGGPGADETKRQSLSSGLPELATTGPNPKLGASLKGLATDQVLSALRESADFDVTNVRETLRRAARRLGFSDLSSALERDLRALGRKDRLW